MSYQCKKCGSAVPEDARFCSNCGEKVTALRCPNCGKRLPEDSAFCTYCGAKIAAEQAVPSVPQPEPTVPETMVESFTNLVASPEQEQPAAPANAAAGISTAASEESQTPNTSHQEARAAKAFEAHSTVNTSDNDIDEASGSQHHYHLTRRKLKLNVRGISSAFEETDLNVNDCTVVISDHLLKKDEPVLTQFLIPDLRQIFVGRTISVPWLCSALLFTILLLAYLVSDVGTMGARASSLLIICAVMSWIMAWYRTITFCFKDGKKIVIRGREKDVMLGLKQDLLSRIEAEPDYTGDLSDVIIKNTQYYLPEFEKARRNEKCRFNWAAFFFNGIFAYYRKSQEVFWHYYKWPFIIYAVIVLGISGSGFLAFKSDTGLAAWMVAVTILSVAINIYLLVTNIRFGKNFNKEYYQHCMVQAENSEITPRTSGTSTKNAILYWIVMSLCAGLIAGIAGALVSTAFLGGVSNIWDAEEKPSVSENNSEYYIWDQAGILSDEDHIALILQIDDVVKKHNCGIYIVTISSVSNSGYSDALDAAQKMYGKLELGIGSDHNGVLLLMSDEDRYFAIVSFGDYATTIFNNDGIEYLQNISVPYLENDDWYGGLSAYVSAASELLDGIRPSVDMSLTISDFIGDYTYDASFENPDGTWTDFLYSLSIEPGNDGVLISEVWRGIYSFCDDWASQNDLDGNTLYFVVKYGDNAGTHSLTYIPAAQSPYGSDTIYVDGDTEMPYLRDTYVSATSYVPSTDYSAPFSAFVGTWQDENDENAYLFVGYGDETEETAYAYAFVPTGDYQVQLIENGSTNAFGNFMRYGSEPEFSIDLTRESGWIDATVYYGATGVEKNFRFLPVDPNTCAYRNPYYIGGESANEPCANDYDFGSGNTVYDYALDSSSGYDFNHEPENWGDLINGFNALNENLENNFWDIVGAMN